MQNVKRIVCLANSRKLGGRCIAGREWRGGRAGRWVRPVSDRENRDVSEYERQYEDGSDPRILDVIDVPLREPLPQPCQPENWLLDPEYHREKSGRLSWFDLPALADPAAPLRADGCSSYEGRNDRVPLDAADSIGDSLRLLRIDDLALSVFRPGEAFGNAKRRVQARFPHAGRDYALWVTDPRWERYCLAKPDGRYRLGACYLTVSLGEPYRGFRYKLVAAIMDEELGPPR